MNCEKSRELFADYLGGELAPAEASQLRLHLKSCDGCRRELGLLSRAKATLMQALPEEPMPQHLTFGSSKMRRQRRGWLDWLRTPRVVGLVAATASFLVCVGGLALVRAQIELNRSGFRISFGQTQSSDLALNRAIETRPVGVTQQELEEAVKRAVQGVQSEQDVRLQSSLQELRGEVDARRDNDMKQVARGLKYLEENQSLVWREAAKNSSYLETLARDVYVKTSASQQ